MGRHYIDIIHEDRDIIVVNKPRGLEVITAGPKRGAGSLFENVRSYLMHKFEGARGSFAKPLHRLDKETTGAVLFAKSKAGLKLAEDIKRHNVKRIYLCIVEGVISKDGGTIDRSLKKEDLGFGKKVGIAFGEEGKKAITHYRVIERYENATMLEVNLETGFTHQIRVHMASINHPLVGDKVYNPHSRVPFPRQALHAERIVFHHPSSGAKIDVSAEVPRDLTELIDKLRSEC